MEQNKKIMSTIYTKRVKENHQGLMSRKVREGMKLEIEKEKII